MTGTLIERPKRTSTDDEIIILTKPSPDEELERRMSKITSGYTILTRSNTILDDTIHISKGNQTNQIKLDIRRILPITMDAETPGMYEGLLNHISLEDTEIRSIENIIEIPNGHPAIKILLNNTIFGYYLPDKNSFIFGNITWHKDYMIIMQNAWPQIIQEI